MAKMFAAKEGGNEYPATVIGDAVKLEGKFTGSGNVTVRGEIVGTLNTTEDIVIEASAKITADVEGNNISVAGEIHGNVLCHGQLQLLSSGKIFGDVTTQILSVETGAIIKGQCSTGITEAAANKVSSKVA